MKYTFEYHKITNCYDCPCCAYPSRPTGMYACMLQNKVLDINVISEKHKDCPLKGEE